MAVKVGTKIDQMRRLTIKDEELAKEIAGLEKKRAALKEKIEATQKDVITLLRAQTLKAGTGKLAKAEIKTDAFPNVTDWDKLYKHILKTKDFALLQKRMAVTHYRALQENNVKLPGVKNFDKVYIKLTPL